MTNSHTDLRVPDGKGKEPGTVARDAYWNAPGRGEWVWSHVETAVLSHYAPQYTDDDYRRLHAQLVDTQRQLDEERAALDPLLTDMRMEDGSLNMEMAGKAVQRLAALILEWFEGNGAKNYSEMSVHPRGKPYHFAFIVQKIGQGAKTPHELRIEAEAKLAAITTEAAGRVTFDLIAHLERQRLFSRETFGPGARTAGVIDHIRKELREIEADPSDITEWVDVIILAFDGSWRAGWHPRDIVKAIVAKQTKNEGRTWPDWRTADLNKAIEHDRSGEAALPHMPAGRVEWQSPETAPKNETLRLLIEGSESPLEDESPYSRTIGSLSDDGEWSFVGWSWVHDHFLTGAGKVIGWLPFDQGPLPPAPSEKGGR